MPSLLMSGVELMLVGMGTVFFFLTTLVFATIGMSKLVSRIQPAVVVSETQQDDELAAITAAIHMHRKRNSSRK